MLVLRDNPLTTQAAMSRELGDFTAALANLKLGASRLASEPHVKTSTSTNKDDEGSVVAATTTFPAGGKSRTWKRAVTTSPVIVLDSDSEAETPSQMPHRHTNVLRKSFPFCEVHLLIVS